MEKLTTSLIFIFGLNLLFGQPLKEKVSKIYYSDTNMIRYSYSNYPETLFINLDDSDTISPGTDSHKGILMTAYIGKDTLLINDDNHPYERYTYVTVRTPNGDKVIIFRFNSSPSNFSKEYILSNQHTISFETPEVYELANIIWNISPSGEKATDLQKSSPYYKKVKKYFKPYLNHPIFEKLKTNDTNYFQNYYEFRENSYMYEFRNGKIEKGENYNYVFGKDWAGYTNLFSELLPLIQDFSDKSNFRSFYKNNLDFYFENSKEVQHFLPIQNMWNWLEQEFPERVNTYKIVFSPLILGSHSTQKYYGQMVTNDSVYTIFTETIMFICDAYHIKNFKKTSDKEKQGMMSGIVFTEIDHNYVNPVSYNYWNEIEETFNGNTWTDANKNNMYDSPFTVFNEYMTHSLFCLWALENYDAKTAEFVIRKRIDLNAKYRGFIKFEEFNAELTKLRKENPDKKVAELYPQLLEWSKTQK